MKYLILILLFISNNLLGQTAPGVPETLYEEYILTTTGSNQTINVPAGATEVTAYVVGAGGGGGSGRQGAAATVRCGGGGGAGGGLSFGTFTLASLGNPTTLRYTIGAGGTGGIAQATASTNGNAGNSGGQSLIGTANGPANVFISAGGGLGGNGGTATNGTAGTASTFAYFLGAAGGAASTTGAAGSAGSCQAACRGRSAPPRLPWPAPGCR